ncbi:cytochrome b/b6 domain-containing protein [Parasphingorhabdus sp.]|uniref:cytochrome b/b6 domain-containing protein n=1 Tax=Parasphingorhabdus sp. TaxID=2709688 RepID=UPI003267CCFF
MPEETIIPVQPRHRLTTRLWHWINALCLIVLLMSGLTIFNAHPRLYWGEYGANGDYAWMAVGSSDSFGYLRFGETRIETTGVLGNWEDSQGKIQKWAFPGWATIPSTYSLADGRRWHFFFAWIFSVGLGLFMIGSLWNRHIQQDLRIGVKEWRPSVIWRSFQSHLKPSVIRQSAGQDYNIIQKLSYVGVIFILLPLMIFSGLAMSPAMDANWPFLTDIFGGRQSARSLHFIAAFLLALFFVVHMIMVLLSGPIRQTASMIFGGKAKEPSA